MKPNKKNDQCMFWIFIALLVGCLGIGSCDKGKENTSGCSLPQTPHNGNYEVRGCEGILKDPFYGPCFKNPKTNFPVGQVVDYFCSPGFILRGAKELKCLPTNKWSGPFPRCCKPRPGKNNAGHNNSTANGELTKKRQVSLDVYEKALEKTSESEATDDDELVSCPPLKQTKNVVFECLTPDGRYSNCEQGPFPPYTVAHLKCAKYYKSAEDLAYRYRKCKPDGTWSTEGFIACVSDCGKSSMPKKPLIINGVTSERGQWPWHAALYIRSSRGTFDYACGGSLISHSVILTAAHCVTRPATEITLETSRLITVLGKFQRSFGTKDENEQLKHVKKIIVHPNYSSLNFESDIALIILHSPVEYTFYVRPICFPENYDSLIEEYQIQEGNLGTVVGWGITETGQPSETLKEVRLPVVSAKTCIDSWKDFFESQTRYTNFCAGYRNGSGVCNGDSGGGMYFPTGDDQKWYIQGIVSVGPASETDAIRCNSHQYFLFTRVGRFSDWIVRTLSSDGYI